MGKLKAAALTAEALTWCQNLPSRANYRPNAAPSLRLVLPPVLAQAPAGIRETDAVRSRR